jgi:MFS family permease
VRIGGNVADAEAALSERQKSLAFFTVLIVVVLEVADSTIVNTALPAIKAALGASPAAMQWIVAGYLLCLGSLLLLGGRLGDAFGYRRMFLIGVSCFVAASVLCGLAQSPAQLVLARIAQGAAGAMMGPQTMAIVQLLYTPIERVSRLAWFGIIVGLSAIVGPIIGGVLIEWNPFGLGWRLIFLINLPVGALALMLGRSTLPMIKPSGELRIDPVGAGLFAFGFGGVLLALIQGAELGWPLWAFALIAGGAMLAGLGWRRAVRRRRGGEPAIIEPGLFALRTFRWGIVAALAFSSGAMGFLLILAVSLQQGLGLSPLATALIHIPFGLGVMLGVGLIGPRLLPRFGRWLPLSGGVMMLTGILSALALVGGGASGGVALIGALALGGAGFGTLSGPLGPIVVAEVDRAHAGTASATMRTAQQLGGSFGIAIVGAAYFSAGGKLVGLLPGAIAFALLISGAMLAVWLLPDNIFGPRKPAGH